MTDKFKKQVTTLTHLLVGKGYYEALVALEFAQKFHTGMRKDKITPEFSHQISIALFAMTLPDIMYPQELIATIMCHDTPEDYGISFNEIRDIFRDKVFADRVCGSVDNLTKTYRGVKKDEDALFAAMALDPIASIAKPCDRIHNLQSMGTVFTKEKKIDYIEEAEAHIIPMAKKARKNFPYQRMAYENMKWMMTSQIELIRQTL